MVKLIFLAILFMALAGALVALLFALLTMLVIACAIGVPVYLLSRSMLHRHGLARQPMNPIQRLQNLYADGKIDLFEFERRVAHLVTLEH